MNIPVRSAWMPAALLAGLLIWLPACYPVGPDSVEDYDLVGTAYNRDFNFAGTRTYYLVDSVVHVTDNPQAGTSRLLSRSLDRVILDEIASNLNQLGYTRITALNGLQRPDLVVTVAGFASTNLDIYYDNWYGYWGWWGGWSTWYPGYGSGWYPVGVPSVYTYSTGTLLIEMSGPNSPRAGTNTFPLAWVAALNGLLTDNDENTGTRAVSGIRKAFAQSPYLRNP